MADNNNKRDRAGSRARADSRGRADSRARSDSTTKAPATVAPPMAPAPAPGAKSKLAQRLRMMQHAEAAAERKQSVGVMAGAGRGKRGILRPNRFSVVFVSNKWMIFGERKKVGVRNRAHIQKAF